MTVICIELHVLQHKTNNKVLNQSYFLFLLPIAALKMIFFNIILFLLLVCLRERKPETDTVHSHYYSYILDVVQLSDEGGFECREYFFDTDC